jgi:hypothetical protein
MTKMTLVRIFSREFLAFDRPLDGTSRNLFSSKRNEKLQQPKQHDVVTLFGTNDNNSQKLM